MSNCVVSTNPAIIHLMDGDYDGDQLHIVLPTTKEGAEDALKMDIFKYISEYNDEFRPSKEIAMHSPEQWSKNEDHLNMQISRVSKESTTGKSVSWKDLINPDYNNSYLKKANINSSELKALAHGVTKETIFTTKYDSEFKEKEGRTATDAVRSYRVIKSLTPKSGAIANSLMTLAIVKARKVGTPEEDNRRIVAEVGFTKHILCQDAISAKHGPSQIKAANKIYSAFYNDDDNELKTKDEYIQALIDFGVPKKYAKTTIDVYWRGKPMNIMEILHEEAPHYLLTRRTSRNESIEACIESDDLSLHSKNLNYDI